MSRTTSIQRPGSLGTAYRHRNALVIGLAALVLLVVGYVAVGTLLPPRVKISPGNGASDVPVDSQLKVSTSWLRGNVQKVTIKEIALGPDGAPTSERYIEGRLDGDEFVTGDGSPLLRPDARYEVTVEAELTDLSLSGPHQRRVTEQAVFQTITTPVPLAADQVHVVELGRPIEIEFNTPMESMTYELSPAVPSSVRPDENNPRKMLISFEGYEQGQSYELRITGGQAVNGIGIARHYTLPVSTTAPLKVTFVPGDGEAAVPLATQPSLTFSEEIRNPEAVESLVSIEPGTMGAWEWVEPDRLEFQPLDDWQQGAQVTIRLKGGPEALRGSSGSYLRENVESTFTTKPSKLIDVNLAEQKVYLYDDEKLVRTLICSSGSQATPSLTGTYAIYAKAEKVDMRGEGYFAPNVPWVLMFNGDYTIHGNYWATSFGTPSSHGCIGLPVSDAEWLYNWSPIGTIVSIHY